MRDRFVQSLTEIARADPRVMLLTADLGFGVLTKFAQELPKQFLNVGVAEQNMTMLASGLAMEGRIVFTYSIANFPILRCLEQIRNDALYHDANVKVVSIGGGFSYGSLGMSHHATEDLAIMRALPQMTVVAPSCKWEVQEATSAIAERPGVCFLRLDKSGPDSTAHDGERFELGKIRKLEEGDDLTLVVTGGIVEEVLKASKALRDQHRISCRVLAVHCLKPFDTAELLAAARETGGLLTVEEHVVEGGLAGVVAETCLEGGVAPRAFRRLGIRDRFVSVVGSQEYLREHCGLSSNHIIQETLKLTQARTAI